MLVELYEGEPGVVIRSLTRPEDNWAGTTAYQEHSTIFVRGYTNWIKATLRPFAAEMQSGS